MKDVVMNYHTDVMTEAAELMLMIAKSYLHAVTQLNHLDAILVYVWVINTSAFMIKIWKIVELIKNVVKMEFVENLVPTTMDVLYKHHLPALMVTVLNL